MFLHKKISLSYCLSCVLFPLHAPEENIQVVVAEMSQATRDSNGKLPLFLKRLYYHLIIMLICTS